MVSAKKLSRNFTKIQKIWIEQGSITTLNKLVHHTKKSFGPNAKKRTLQSRNRLFAHVKEDKLKQQTVSYLNKGFLRSPKEIKQDIINLSSDHLGLILREGTEVLENKYRLYGHLEVKYRNDEFSWLSDPLSGYEWSLKQDSGKVSLNKPVGTDVKNIWEIARFQFLYSLTYAYIVSGNKKYARFAIEKVNSWINENPFLQGPHWARAMEAAIRITNWCVYLPLLDVVKISSKYFLGKLSKSIIEHIIYIRENLETSPSLAGNHYLANLVGLLFAPLVFPSLHWANENAEFSINELNKEILKQFLKSGLNFEGSVAYHRLSLEISLVGIALIRKLGYQIPSHVIDSLKKANEVTTYFTSTCSEFPLIGDNDSGIFLKYFYLQESNNFKYLIKLSETILDNNLEADNLDEFLCIIHYQKAKICETSHDKYLACVAKKKIQLRNFDGLFIAHHGDESLIFNTITASGGHTHNDKLSVYPVIGKRPLFIDRGSFSYTGYIEKRHVDRKSDTHNGLVINGWEQSPLWKDDVFYMTGKAKCLKSVKKTDETITLTGWHNGYKTNRINLMTYRKVGWDIRQRRFIITDWVEGKHYDTSIQCTWYFLINPDWLGEIFGSEIRFICGDKKVYIEIDDNINRKIVKASFCPSYQKETPCKALKISYSGKVGEKIKFNLKY